MDREVNQKMIKEMCGIVSFKRGVSFCQMNKVVFKHYSSESCEAAVKGKEDFHVTIKIDDNGRLHTACSCPALASFTNDCQHIAAVLLSICEYQQKGTFPAMLNERQQDGAKDHSIAEGLLNLFNGQPKRSSRHQLHFENRKVLNTEFTCKAVNINPGQFMFGIEIRVDSIYVQNIRNFLEQVKESRPILLSNSFTYHPNLHCFQEETDDVIQQLIQIAFDERMSSDGRVNKPDDPIRRSTLLIPPSSWERLVPLLTKTSVVKLEYNEHQYNGLHLSDEVLPLKFTFVETEDQRCHLNIEGLSRIVVLNAYETVLAGGRLICLKSEQMEHLLEVKRMVENSGFSEIVIPEEQIDPFLKKVVPGLKRLGEVHLSQAISRRLVHTPLIAKLYLDRLKNRLLAGLEFHYEGIVINPLESKEGEADIVQVRDEEKEKAILQLMEDSSFAKTDSGYLLHNEELEYQFLYHVVPKLQKLVQIYATTSVRNRILRKNAHPRIKIGIKKERTDWLEFKFEMEGIPEKQIREILLALEEKRKYYRLQSGALLSLETREFKEINRFFNALPVQKEDWESGLNLPVVRGLQLLDSGSNSSVFTVEESFRQFLEKICHPERQVFDVPKRLAPILYDYQKHGYQWMKTLARYGFGGILADDMGLGKTLQSIAFILSELPAIRNKKRPVFIVCPSSLTYNWLGEITKFAPEIKAVVVDGSKKERSSIQKTLTDIDIIITSYPLLIRDQVWYEKQSFHTVFFDEAQAFKNPMTQTAKAVKKIQAEHRFALTGTPVENSLEELWSIFYVVFPELFLGLKEYNNLSRDKVARRVRPFLLRRMKESVLLELPEKNESMNLVELLPDQKKLYAAYLAKLRHDTLKHLDKDTLRKNRIKILAGLTRLRQICCHPALFVDGYKGSSAKFEQLMQIVEESKLAGKRVLIFSQFTKMLQLIGKELAGRGLPFFYLDGHTSSEERIEKCHRFNAGERDLFLISLKAGGTGLNLTGADTVILYDMWWNPAVEAQAADRAYRIGQKNKVQVIKLMARGTIEEKINDLQAQKRHLIEEVIDSKKSTSFALTEEDIREILMI
ncbi:DEAD/DEAH box helicase [Domibacillus robiginosus]|uniref:DEAD/DEAH box helicase n=1 Tax=Domibacillus robiginosus TaxID=1071054 RepID=UPI00067DBD68|nr:DEAD/DEAH box helicase [Domibacillus robiginosus]